VPDGVAPMKPTIALALIDIAGRAKMLRLMGFDV
jgi:hypothetical protein